MVGSGGFQSLVHLTCVNCPISLQLSTHYLFTLDYLYTNNSINPEQMAPGMEGLSDPGLLCLLTPFLSEN